MAWLRMARRFTRGSAARLALTVLAVAWGVALVAGVCLANRAVLRAFVEVIDTMAGRAALEVVAGEGGLFPEGVAATVGTVPGVEAAAPSVKGAAYADGGELLTVYGVDLTGDAPERVYGARLELDDPPAPSPPRTGWRSAIGSSSRPPWGGAPSRSAVSSTPRGWRGPTAATSR